MSFEYPHQPENFDAHKDRKREESERISRFGGKAGKIARIFMFATALAGGYEGITHRKEIASEADKIITAIDERDKAVEKEITHHAEGVVIEKRHVPASSMAVPAGKFWSAASDPGKWKVTIMVDGEESVVDITRDQFDSYKDGDKVRVVYQVRGSGPLRHRENVTINNKE